MRAFVLSGGSEVSLEGHGHGHSPLIDCFLGTNSCNYCVQRNNNQAECTQPEELTRTAFETWKLGLLPCPSAARHCVAFNVPVYTPRG